MIEDYLIILIILILMKLKYMNSILMYMLTFSYLFKLNWLEWSYCILDFSISNYSINLLILTLWIFSMIYMNMLMNKSKMKLLILFLMKWFIICLFISMNFLMFYLMFESSLLMIFLLMINWGYSMNRILASFYLMFYTMTFSLPMLMIIFYLMIDNGTLNFKLMELIKYKINDFMFLFLLMSFLIKIPMYSMHLWLLKAHVESPYYGSMILSSILLKLGTYGLLRLMILFPDMFNDINEYLMIMNLMGMLILSILCLRQLDLKLIVAMSSIIHMSMLMTGMLTFTKSGIYGSYFMMISHGLSSSGLFYLIEMIYKQTNSRLIFLNKGMINFMPSMTLMWFMLCSTNMSSPFSLNLVGEIFLLMSLINTYDILIFFLFFYCLLSFIYSIYLFSIINHGKYYFKYNMFNGKLINYFTLMMHWIPLNMFIFNLNMLI